MQLNLHSSFMRCGQSQSKQRFLQNFFLVSLLNVNFIKMGEDQGVSKARIILLYFFQIIMSNGVFNFTSQFQPSLWIIQEILKKRFNDRTIKAFLVET